MSEQKNILEYTLGLKKDNESRYISTRSVNQQEPVELQTFNGNKIFNQDTSFSSYNTNWLDNTYSSIDTNGVRKEPSGANFFSKFFTPKVTNGAIESNGLIESTKIKKKVIIAIAVVVSILAVILIATLSGLGSYGLLNNGASYLESCALNPCMPFKGLLCYNGSCFCETGKYWDKTKCLTLLPFGSNCSFEDSCVTGLKCLNNICQCSNTTYYSGGQCVNKLSYGSSCSICNYSTCPKCNPCDPCQNYANSFCDSNSLICSCTSSSYYDSLVKQCLIPASYNQPCLSSEQCQKIPGDLTCTNNVCICAKPELYWSTYNQKCLFCPSDWTIVSYGNYQTCIKDMFIDFTSPTDITNANNHCLKFDAHIVKLNDSALNNKLKSLFLKKYDLFYWLDTIYISDGLYLYNSFKYIPSTLVDFTLIPWCYSQPDGGQNELDLGLSVKDWCLIDVESRYLVQGYFMCQKFS